MGLNKSETFYLLRKKAEEKLNRNQLSFDSLKEKELHYELNIRQFELEIQNEELIETQTKLEKSINDYTELFDHAPVGYFILDQEGIIVNANHSGCLQLGFNKKQILGKPLSVFLSSMSHQDDYYRHRNMVIKTGEVQEIEVEIVKKNGIVFFALIKSNVICDDQDNFKYLLCAISDISKQKEQERKYALALIQEKELSDLKSHFISLASHEFRTPLATVLSSIDIIKILVKNKESEKFEKHIERIKSSVNNLTMILNDFLSLDKLEKGNVSVGKEKTNLEVLCREIVLEVEKEFKNDQRIQYVHYGNTEIITDKNILRLIILVFLSNASKFSAMGDRIELSTSVNDNLIVINIKDYGIGIPSNEQNLIFKRFFTAKNAENIPGAGLGLNIAKKYIELLNGEISFSSIENKGSIFTITFPV